MLSVATRATTETLALHEYEAAKEEEKAIERIATAPVSWTAIMKTFATYTGDTLARTLFHMLQRPQSTMDTYIRWKEETAAVYDELSSAVLCEKLGYHAVRCRDSKKFQAVRPPLPTTVSNDASSVPAFGAPYMVDVHGDQCLVAMHPNTFPYNVAPDVRHDVLWSERRLPAHMIKSQLEVLLGDNMFLWYENAQALKSLPNVFHVHVFSQIPAADAAAAAAGGEEEGDTVRDLS